MKSTSALLLRNIIFAYTWNLKRFDFFAHSSLTGILCDKEFDFNTQRHVWLHKTHTFI